MASTNNDLSVIDFLLDEPDTVEGAPIVTEPPQYIDLPDLPPPYVIWNEQQKKAIEEMKARVKQYINPARHYDEYFSRFLNSNNYNVDKAVEMFMKSLELRKIYDCDNILETFPKSKYFPILRKYWPAKLVGKTRDGSYVFIERIGLVDLPSLFKHVPLDELMKLHMWTLESQEKLRRQEFRRQGWSSGYIIIQDCQGLGLSHKAGLDFVKRSAEIDQDCYPGMIRRTYFVNTPSVFNFIFSLIKPLIPDRTVRKLEVLGDAYHETFHKLIPEDVLPPFYGGTNNTAFPPGGVLVTDLTRHGTKVNIKAGDKYRQTMQVKAGELIELMFMTEDKEIAFGVYCLSSPDSKTAEVVLASKTYNSHELSVWIDIEAKKDGIYVFEWDNSNAWLRSKDLVFLLRMKKH